MCEHEELLDCGEYVCIKCGIVLGQEFQRFALRVNSEFDVTPWLTIGENL